MFKYIRIIFLGVTFLFCKRVNDKHIIKKPRATCYKFDIALDKYKFLRKICKITYLKGIFENLPCYNIAFAFR